MGSNQHPVQWDLRVTSLGIKCLELATQHRHPSSIPGQPYEVYGRQCARRTDFPPSTLFSPHHIIPPMLHIQSFKYHCNLKLKLPLNNTPTYMNGWSQWPRGLRRRSTAARLLRLWVRIPPGGMDVCLLWVLLLSGRGLCDKLITRPEESYRLWCVIVCDLETSWIRRPWPNGGCHAKNKQINIYEWLELYFCSSHTPSWHTKGQIYL